MDGVFMTDEHRCKTHPALMDWIEDTTDEYLASRGLTDIVQGRIWKIGGSYFIGFWNSYEQIKSFGVDRTLEKLNELFKEVLGTNVKNAIFNPYHEDSGGRPTDDIYYYKQFSSGDLQPSIYSNQHQNKAIHLMDPAVKGAAMKAAGIKPKTITTPDFIKRQMVGADE